MPLEIVRNDITKMRVDAIVNAANSSLQQGGGVCGAKHVIHTVGPVWQGGVHNEEELLSSCYKNTLNLALEHGLDSIAFPLITSGVYGYPKDQALRVAVSAIGSFLLKHEMMVYLVVFDKEAYALSDKLFKSIRAYIDDNYIDKHTDRRRRYSPVTYQLREMSAHDAECLEDALEAPSALLNLDRVVNRIGESFTEMLLRLIDQSGKTDPEVYRRANLDRRLFSKIRGNLKYAPSKNTALALAVALELNLDQTADLLRRAGFALSPSSRFDLIVAYFISEGNYNIFEINEAMFAFDESLLGG